VAGKGRDAEGAYGQNEALIYGFHIFRHGRMLMVSW